MEKHVSGVIRDIFDRGAPPRRGDPKAKAMATFAVMQWLRTPGAILEKDACNMELCRLLKASGDLSHDEEMAFHNALKPMEASVEESIDVAKGLADTMWDLDQFLLINDGPVGFITSDIGLVMNNQWLEGITRVGTSGFGCKGVQVLLPLSPRHLLMIYHSAVYKVAPRGQIVCRTSDPADVWAVNQLILRSAHENVYYDRSTHTMAAIDDLVQHTTRSPRHTQVRGEILPTEYGKILHLHTGDPAPSVRLPWVRIRRNAQRVPIRERLRPRIPSRRVSDDGRFPYPPEVEFMERAYPLRTLW